VRGHKQESMCFFLQGEKQFMCTGKRGGQRNVVEVVVVSGTVRTRSRDLAVVQTTKKAYVANRDIIVRRKDRSRALCEGGGGKRLPVKRRNTQKRVAMLGSHGGRSFTTNIHGG